MLELLHTVAPTVIATESSNPRVLRAAPLAELAGGPAIADPADARRAGRELAGPDGALLVCGSLYLLHDLAERLPVAVQPTAHLD
jgi:folylpolyglutamate synthase/dihydropteroate synthase